MSLDFYPGQPVACIEDVGPFSALAFGFYGICVPELGKVYKVAEAQPCQNCGVHIRLRELGPTFYPHAWFRPVEPKEMDVLRGLLAPDGGLPDAPVIKERVDA